VGGDGGEVGSYRYPSVVQQKDDVENPGNAQKAPQPGAPTDSGASIAEATTRLKVATPAATRN
jgi:hypothetical protein